MPDDQTQVGGGTQPVAQGGQTAQPQGASPVTATVPLQAQVAPPKPTQKESNVEDLLSMWTSDDDLLGVANIPVKPAEMEKPQVEEPVKPQVVQAAPVPVTQPAPAQPVVPVPVAAPISPRPTPPPAPAPTPSAVAPQVPTQEVSPVTAPNPQTSTSTSAQSVPRTPLKGVPGPVAQVPFTPPSPPRPVQPVPTQATAPVQAPIPVTPPSGAPAAPSPAPQAPMPAPSPLPPRPLAPTPPQAPQPMPSVPPRPAQPPMPQPMLSAPPRPTPPPPAPAPMPSVPPRPAPAPMPQPAPSAPPRPTPPPAPAPSPLPPRPAPAPQPAPMPQAPRPTPPPAPSPLPPRPTSVPLTPRPQSKDAPIEAELVEDEEKSNKAVADLLKSIKKEEGETVDDGESFMAQFKELLAELHISPRKILKWVGCIVIFAGLIYGGYFVVTNYGTAILEKIGLSGDENPETPTDTPPPEDPKRPRPIGITTPIDSGIDEGVEVGTGRAQQPIVVTDTGIMATVIVGQEAILATPFSYYVTQFKLLENAYAVDVNQLLNQATDRRARYKAQLLLMNALYAKANVTLGEMQAEADAVNLELTKHTQAQTIAEKNFLDEVAALNGPATDVLLEQFTNEAQRVVVLRARSRALARMINMYNNALPRFEARVRDLELNQEPLISGLKVYDVGGSDLQLIVPVQSSNSSAASTPTAGTQSNSARGIFPIVSPQEFAGNGPDFITAPGGYQR